MRGRGLTTSNRSLTPTNSRPQTPNSSSKSSFRNTKSPPPKLASTAGSPRTRPTYSQLLSSAHSEWNANNDGDDDEEDETPEYAYNEGLDEDEFGLPSITSMRRQTQKRIQSDKSIDPGGGSDDIKYGSSLFSVERPLGRPRANSSDIALERGPPSYPTAKKSEGKILRPQYKDILRG